LTLSHPGVNVRRGWVRPTARSAARVQSADGGRPGSRAS
jgi:hypothetical protein